jgi:hypothetical protein
VKSVKDKEETKLQVQQNKTSSWSSVDAHPSDKNKDVRWMGHSFIPRESANPVGNYKERYADPTDSD